MPLNEELAALFERDLTRLLQQLEAWDSNTDIWHAAPGATNSAGNLALHIEGNLREFIGRQLGRVKYRRIRDQEFAFKGLPVEELTRRVKGVREIVPRIVRSLSEDELNALFPGDPLGGPIVTRQFLVHLLGHLNYHLGQIDYSRRTMSESAAVDYARLR